VSPRGPALHRWLRARRTGGTQRDTQSGNQGGTLMLRTVLMIAMFGWLIDLGFQFGTGILPLLLVVTAIVLALNHMFRRRLFY
jgi:hypothetical protein